MARVARHLGAGLDEPIDPAVLDRLAGLSSRQLARVFTRTVGESPRAHARRLRLERAALRLRTSPRASILTIAVEAGFSSHAAFTRGFRQRFGHSPAAYRQLESASAQPRSRLELWHSIAACGLRPYVEERVEPNLRA